MKSKSYSLFNSSRIAITGIAVLLAGQSARATDLYWDANGVSTAAVAPNGTWGTSIFWNTDSTGAASGVSQASTLIDDNLFFSAGTNGLTGTVSLITPQAANSITFDDPVVFTVSGVGGIITLGSTAGAGVFRTANAAATISNPITLGTSGAQTAYNFSNSGTGLLTIGAITGTGTSSATTQTIAVSSSSSGGITLSGIIADAGTGGKVALNINNTSTGVSTLSAVNTFTGGISISAGTLKAASQDAALGAGLITLGASGSADATLTGDNKTRTNAITLFGSGNTGTLRIAGGGSVTQMPTFSGAINLNGHDLTIGLGAASTSGVKVTGQITGSNTITFDNSNALVTGATQIGATANNPTLFTGNVIVAAGPAELLANFSADNAFSVASGAKLNLAASNVTIGGLNNVSGTGGTVSSSNTSSRTLVLAGTGSYSFAGVVQNNTTGVITLTKNGPGTQVLSGANTYSGTTTITGGILEMAGTNSSAGAITLTAGTLQLNNASNGGLASGTLSLNGGTLEATGAARTLSNSTTISANSTFAGSQNIELSGVVTETNSRTLTNNISGGTLTLSNELRLSSSSTNYTLTFEGSGNTLVSGVISNGTGGSTSSSLTYNGSGTLTLSNAGNTFSGTTTVMAGTLSLSTASLANTSTVSVFTGGNLNLTHGSIDDVAVLEFDGIPQPEGIYPATPGGFITGTGSIRVVAPSGYSTWASTNAGNQSPSQDFDNDGTSNGVEFFMNAPAGFTANPSLAGGTVTWTNGGNISSSEYGTQFVVQTSTDLVNWAPVSFDNIQLSNTGESVSYTPTGSGPQFVRLKVTPN